MFDYITTIFDQLLFKNCDFGSVFVTQSMNQQVFPEGKHKVIQLPDGAAYFEELHQHLTLDDDGLVAAFQLGGLL